MFAKSFLVALAVPALISAAALPQTIPDNWDENSSDIVGGVAAAQGDLPFIVSVQLSGSHFCGGSLVNANTVVSAAHCYEGRTGSSWTIRAGSLVCDHLFLDP
jgi:trypsin